MAAGAAGGVVAADWGAATDVLAGAALGTDGPHAAARDTPPTAANILNAERRLMMDATLSRESSDIEYLLSGLVARRVVNQIQEWLARLESLQIVEEHGRVALLRSRAAAG